jgi:multiple sugar transport system ATP-binding protein
MADIAIRSLTKRYDNGHLAVDSVDVDVADGELLVLVGPSGCGKSTLLRMLAGLEEVTAGSVTIGDRDITDLQPKDRDIAMVFQSYALYPHMTVRKNIGYPLKLAGRPKEEIEARVTEAARVLQLDDVLDRRPAQLSGGQRQRVAMGRAIVRQPTVFLMDEPLSNLDAKLRVQMRAEIARLQRALAVTMIYVTHDQVEAMTMGTRVAVLKGGRIEQIDTPQRLYDRPATSFVATFIGSPAMNLFETRLERNDADGLDLWIARQRVAVDPQVLARAPRLLEEAGRPLLVGLRPEAFADIALEPSAPADRVVEASVDLVEALGSELVVHAVVDETPLVVRLPPRSRVAPGSVAKFAVDTSQLHVFDPVDGRSLLVEGS